MRLIPGVTALLIVTAAASSAPAAPDNTLGMAIFGAYVDQDGTLLRGSGITGSAKLGTGQYDVVFGRDVSNCFYNVTSIFGGQPAAVQVAINAVEVVTND